MKFISLFFVILLTFILLIFNLNAGEIIKNIKFPDPKLGDGIKAKVFPLQGQKETFSFFGWTPVYWDIDLKKIESLSSIKLFSDNPQNALHSIAIFGSRDNKNWFFITDLASDKNKKIVKNSRLIYEDKKIHTAARYLKFALIARRLPSTYFFDELEIRRPLIAYREKNYKETAVSSVKEAIDDILTAVGSKQRLLEDIKALDKIVDRNPKLKNRLRAAKNAVSAMKLPKAAGFDSRFPQNDIQKELFRIYAEHLRILKVPELTFSNPYRFVWNNVFTENKNDLKKISFYMMQNEYRSELIQIQNSSDKVKIIESRFEGSPEVLKALEFYCIPWTDTAECIPVSTILLPKNLNEKLELFPGLLNRFYLTVNSENLKAGVYKINWHLDSKIYPVVIKVANVKLAPSRLNVGTWDYANVVPSFALTPKNVDSAVALMNKMQVNTPWSGLVSFPSAKDFDANGNFTGKIDSSGFERTLKLFPNKRCYCVFINVEMIERTNIGGHACGTEKFYICASNWFKAWDKRLKELGMKPGQVQWLLVDEVISDPKKTIMTQWSKAFRMANPEILRNWSDPIPPDITDPKFTEMFSMIDSFCSGRDVQYIEKYRQFLLDFRKKGKNRQWWTYNCNGPSRLFDPFSYYRMHGTGAWKDKITGIGFWSFGDAGAATAFNEYLLHWAIFTPACIDTDKVYSTLALEAVREGAQEYELYSMLEERMRSFAPIKRKKAKKLLDDLREYIVKNTNIHIKWYDAAAKLNREKADHFRNEAIGLLDSKM